VKGCQIEKKTASGSTSAGKLKKVAEITQTSPSGSGEDHEEGDEKDPLILLLHIFCIFHINDKMLFY